MAVKRRIAESTLLKPTLSVFSEYAVNDRRFAITPADGISRDSDGDRIRFGVSFGNTAKIWRGEVALGYGRQQGKDARLTEAAGLILDANLAWRASELTSVLLTPCILLRKLLSVKCVGLAGHYSTVKISAPNA